MTGLDRPCRPGGGLDQSSPWRARMDGPLSGEENMRRDSDALNAQRVPGAVPVIRFFRWSEPTVSYGRLQSEASARALADAAGTRSVVRRPTGGGTVFHAADLSFSLAWRRDGPAFPACLRGIYRALHEPIARAFGERGFDAVLRGPSAGPPSAPGACFDEPVEGDVLWRGKKILGGAIRATSWGRLYQGDVRAEVLGLDAAETARWIESAYARDVFRSAPVREGRP